MDTSHPPPPPPPPYEKRVTRTRLFRPRTGGKDEAKVSRFFEDGKRLVDYVIAYEDVDDDDEATLAEVDFSQMMAESIPQNTTERRAQNRLFFESHLEAVGLQLEYQSAIHSNTKFVLIHAPFDVLAKQAELIKIKMPIYQNDILKKVTLNDEWMPTFLRRFQFLRIDKRLQRRIKMTDYFTQPFIASRLDCYVNHEDKENFFPRTERSRMVYDILMRTRYGSSSSEESYTVGIERLIKNGSYKAAYPLHEQITTEDKEINLETCSDRQFLYECWANFHMFYKYQPVNLIQKYFGTKVGFYFAWLGFYTYFLIPVALLGICCLLYGIITLGNDKPSTEVCENAKTADPIIMCKYGKEQEFRNLSESCFYAKLTYVFDNHATIAFACFMSIWATVFLECWKRYQAIVAYKWNVHDLVNEDEIMRPEFQYRIKKMRMNPVTQEYEPYLPLHERWMRIACSGITVILFICLIFASMVGVVFYRAAVIHILNYQKTLSSVNKFEFFQDNAHIFTSISASVINLFFIMAMNQVYTYIALQLTSWECPRTQSEFDDSFTIKVFLFQFFNFYSSLFYIAFIKGRFVTLPSAEDMSEQCDQSGCMVELVIQLFVVMCGKQFLKSVLEFVMPIANNWYRRLKIQFFETKRQAQKRQRQEKRREIQRQISIKPEIVPLYERDYSLNGVNDQFLFHEYLEMVVQYGFVTLFVAAFPLAPLFAFINNAFEIRSDAYKFIVSTRRPNPSQDKDIGIWFSILEIIGHLAVIVNAVLIAFTSDFIPKIYYRFKKSQHLIGLEGYVDFSMSYFDAKTIDANANYTLCRYRDFRAPPCSMNTMNHTYFSEGQCKFKEYDHTYDFWAIMAYRLIFVLVFEHVILGIKSIFTYVIPDVPTKIVIQLQRERHLARQAILQRQDNDKKKNVTTLMSTIKEEEVEKILEPPFMPIEEDPKEEMSYEDLETERCTTASSSSQQRLITPDTDEEIEKAVLPKARLFRAKSLPKIDETEEKKDELIN